MLVPSYRLDDVQKVMSKRYIRLNWFNK